MAVGEATPLTGTLPGGTQDATVRLHLFNTATMLSPPEFMAMSGGKLKTVMSMRGSRDDWLRIPIPAFLIEHPSAGKILVDTGMHPSVAVDPRQNLGNFLGRLYKDTIQMTADQALPAQLRKRGIEPGDIDLVIMTHMHMDHAGAISEFTKPMYVLGEGEWAAFKKKGVTQGYVHKQGEVAVDFREVPYSSNKISSYSTFSRAFDLFGDGSVRLVSTPGHTLGHQSLILRLKDREALLTGDAAYSLAVLEHERRGWAMADEHKWRRSLREIQLYRREHPNALIVPGHDDVTWPKLQATYE